MDFVTTARIQSSSFPPAAPSAALTVLVGGWKATFRPGRRGSCLLRASRRAFGSREKGICCGGTDDRAGGTVMDTPLLSDALLGAATGVAVPDGDCPRGRLLRFSEAKMR